MGKFDDYINEIRKRAGLPPLVEMKLDEGVDFWAVKNKGATEKHPLGVWASVFPREMLRYGDPQYREELDLHLTVSTVEKVLEDMLGLKRGPHGWLMPIEKFLMTARTYLAGGEESPEEETWEQEPWEDWEDPQMKRGWTARPGSNVVQMQPKTEPRRGARIVHVGKPEGYYDDVLRQMIAIAEEGKKHGATHIDVA